MSVRKRSWTTAKGERKDAWVVDYVDAQGDRHIETFARQKDAKARHDKINTDVRKGVHVAASKTVMVSEAGENWLQTCGAAGLERTTIKTYGEQLQHIVALIGDVKLSAISVPVVRAFQDRLRERKLSRGRKTSASMVRRVTQSLGAIIGDAQERGHCAHNAVREITHNKKHRKRVETRQQGKIQAGVHYPTPDEIRAILAAAPERWRPLLITAVFTGLRASELRGLRWSDVDLKKGALHVRQRADRFNQIGAPKSAAGTRTIPIGPVVVNTLKVWKLACPNGALDLVFPNSKGNVASLENILHRVLAPTVIAAGVVDREGKPKYTGMHALRHFYASWCINRKEDGGRGLPPTMVQQRMGHATIVMTLNTYAHLFPEVKDADELAAAELALIA
jgi:integrase